jgi:PPOX class probable F420-dependent enzyme
MVLKHRLADASYWVYDRARHRAAFAAARQPGTAPDFSAMQGHKYALLVTFRNDGTAVPTPVWFALLDDRRLVTRTEERTAKVRRIRRDPRARVFPCDPRGKPLGAGVDGTARFLESRKECEGAEAALDRHYGRPRRVYERLMADEGGMVYLEVVPAARISHRPPVTRTSPPAVSATAAPRWRWRTRSRGQG